MAFLKSNLEILAQRNPELAERMAALEPDGSIQTTEAESGALTAFRSIPNGGTHFFHSRIDPMEEGASWAAAARPREREVFVIGMGLGYHVQSLVEDTNGIETIHIIEADSQLFHTALRTIDLASVLAHNGIDFRIGNRLEDLVSTLSALSAPFSYCLYLPALSLDTNDYDVVIRQLENRLYEIRRDSAAFGAGVERLMNEMAA